MNTQEAFTKVCLHLWAAEARSASHEPDGDTMCLYAGPNNTACAIGCLLPRDLAEELDLTRPAWVTVLNGGCAVYDRARAYLQGVSNALLSELQEVHDSASSWDDDKEPMGCSLRRLAVHYGLDIPACWAEG